VGKENERVLRRVSGSAAACQKRLHCLTLLSPRLPGGFGRPLNGRTRPPFGRGKRRPEPEERSWHRPVETAWGHPLISRFSRACRHSVAQTR